MSGVGGHADQDDPPQGAVGLAVAAAVQAVVAVGLAAAGRDGSDAAQPGERGFGVQTLRVVTDADQQRGICVGSDTEGFEPTEHRWFHLQVVPLEGPSANGSSRHVLVSHSDITTRKRGELALSYRANHDALTGLANRVQVLRRLAGTLVSSVDPGNVALLFLDLDGCKSVNDSLGHQAGDEVLRVAANRLRAAAREQDLVGRLGGDEFLVCCPRVDAQQAKAIGVRLAEALQAPLQVQGIDLRLSASTGVASGSRGSIADVLLRDEDVAMYRAKELGRGRVEVFTESLRGKARRWLDVAASLPAALAGDELVLHFQPIVDLRSRRIVEQEALLR